LKFSDRQEVFNAIAEITIELYVERKAAATLAVAPMHKVARMMIVGPSWFAYAIYAENIYTI
jgi:hypothetical protein